MRPNDRLMLKNLNVLTCFQNNLESLNERLTLKYDRKLQIKEFEAKLNYLEVFDEKGNFH